MHSSGKICPHWEAKTYIPSDEKQRIKASWNRINILCQFPLSRPTLLKLRGRQKKKEFILF